MVPKRGIDVRATRVGLCALAALTCIGTGCASRRDAKVREAVVAGDYGRARAEVLADMEPNPAQRKYLYDRMMLALAELADGLPESANKSLEEVYEILRIQGLNKDKTVAAVVVNERVKYWKGEPFEQALLWFYIAVQKASVGEWDNARAAANESIFLLKDFGVNEKGERKSTLEIAQNKDDPNLGGYSAIPTNFALGHLMAGLAETALGRHAAAAEHLQAAVQIDPSFEDVKARIESRRFNTVLVVDYGMGPRKVAYGPDGALAKFEPLLSGDRADVAVAVGGVPQGTFLVACEQNKMAVDHMWNNMEDVRVAKSIIGTGVMVAGAGLMTQRDSGAAAVGGAMLLIGAAMKASARADTTHCMILPYRTYVTLINVVEPDSTVQVRMLGNPQWDATLVGIDPPRNEEGLQLCYARVTPLALLEKRGQPPVWPPPPAWQTCGTIVYANDEYGKPVPGDDLPYILGGRCVRRPTEEVLKRYQQAGYLSDLTLVDLENLYRDEGIKLGLDESDWRAGRHVLEGGDSLVCPQAGTIGYLRLFCQNHTAYSPKSPRVRELAAKIRSQRGQVAQR